ncbi:hypothetical protein HK104_009172 [Borealophlyctis nickersoniae]|nr:hypothetical protein HK104_009172 [Borealophlyctis nickersoniae]
MGRKPTQTSGRVTRASSAHKSSSNLSEATQIDSDSDDEHMDAGSSSLTSAERQLESGTAKSQMEADEEFARRLMEEEESADAARYGSGSGGPQQDSYDADYELALRLSREEEELQKKEQRSGRNSGSGGSGGSATITIDDDNDDMEMVDLTSDQYDADLELARQLAREEVNGASHAVGGSGGIDGSQRGVKRGREEADEEDGDGTDGFVAPIEIPGEKEWTELRESLSSNPTCAKCRKTVKGANYQSLIKCGSDEAAETIIPRVASELRVTCKKCNAVTCIACQQVVQDEEVGSDALDHCGEARVVGICALLYLPYLLLKKDSAGPVGRKPTKSKAKAKTNGVGYGSGGYHPFGRPAGLEKVRVEQELALKKVDEEQTRFDDQMAKWFDALNAVLPQPNRDPEPFIFDLMPHAALPAVLAQSCFLPLISKFLVNVRFVWRMVLDSDP